MSKLLSLSSPAGFASDQHSVNQFFTDWGRCGGELARLLQQRNGFYAFEQALHVLGLSTSGARSGLASRDLAGWNVSECWKDSYGGLAGGLLFFAEDIFGGQFAITEDGESIVSFDPETAETEIVADSVEGWAAAIFDDLDFMTGHSLAHQWQIINGRLPEESRLVPKLPFVLGGEYEVTNLYGLNAAVGMRFRGEIAVQIANLPDGAEVQIRFPEA